MKRILLILSAAIILLTSLNSCALEATTPGYYEPQMRARIYYETPPVRSYRHHYQRHYYTPRGHYYYHY